MSKEIKDENIIEKEYFDDLKKIKKNDKLQSKQSGINRKCNNDIHIL